MGLMVINLLLNPSCPYLLRFPLFSASVYVYMLNITDFSQIAIFFSYLQKNILYTKFISKDSAVNERAVRVLEEIIVYVQDRYKLLP